MNDWLVPGALLLVSWATFITVRVFGSLSRKDHERLCHERQIDVDKKLDKLGEKQGEILDLLIDVIRDK